jgi:Arc/MetJ-type ribon-helix-helix transcriptional regulator
MKNSSTFREKPTKDLSKYVLIPVPRTLRNDIDIIVQAGRYVSVSDFIRSACRHALKNERSIANEKF